MHHGAVCTVLAAAAASAVAAASAYEIGPAADAAAAATKVGPASTQPSSALGQVRVAAADRMERTMHALVDQRITNHGKLSTVTDQTRHLSMCNMGRSHLTWLLLLQQLRQQLQLLRQSLDLQVHSHDQQ